MAIKAIAKHAPHSVNIYLPLAADTVDGSFWIADRDYELEEVAVSWGVASTSGTLMLEKGADTVAPNAGTDLLAATVDTSTTADTVTRPALTATLVDRRISRGDRVMMDWAGTIGSLAGVAIQLNLRPVGNFTAW